MIRDAKLQYVHFIEIAKWKKGLEGVLQFRVVKAVRYLCYAGCFRDLWRTEKMAAKQVKTEGQDGKPPPFRITQTETGSEAWGLIRVFIFVGTSIPFGVATLVLCGTGLFATSLMVCTFAMLLLCLLGGFFFCVASVAVTVCVLASLGLWLLGMIGVVFCTLAPVAAINGFILSMENSSSGSSAQKILRAAWGAGIPREWVLLNRAFGALTTLPQTVTGLCAHYWGYTNQSAIFAQFPKHEETDVK